MAAHASSLKRYFLAWVGLLSLTALTVWAASLPHGAWSVPVALGIATVKAGIVVVVFMHFLEHPPAVRLVLATSLVFFGVLAVLVELDVTRRFPLARPQDPGFGSRPPVETAAMPEP